MSRYHLNHVNIRATNLEETRDFYAEVLGLKNGFRPPFPNPGYWMYAGDMPIIHISPVELDSSPRTNPDGMGKGLDHFAMWGSGLAEQLALLEKNGFEYTKRLAEASSRSSSTTLMACRSNSALTPRPKA